MNTLLKYMEGVPSDVRLIIEREGGPLPGVRVIFAHRYGSTVGQVWTAGHIAEWSLAENTDVLVTRALDQMRAKLDEDVRTRIARVLVHSEPTGKCWVCEKDTGASTTCFCSERCRRIAWLIKNPKLDPREYEGASFPK